MDDNAKTTTAAAAASDGGGGDGGNITAQTRHSKQQQQQQQQQRRRRRIRRQKRPDSIYAVRPNNHYYIKGPIIFYSSEDFENYREYVEEITDEKISYRICVNAQEVFNYFENIQDDGDENENEDENEEDGKKKKKRGSTTAAASASVAKAKNDDDDDTTSSSSNAEENEDADNGHSKNKVSKQTRKALSMLWSQQHDDDDDDDEEKEEDEEDISDDEDESSDDEDDESSSDEDDDDRIDGRSGNNKRKRQQPQSAATKKRVTAAAATTRRTATTTRPVALNNIEAQKIWDSQFEQLTKFKQEHGHCTINSKKHFNGSNSLCSWLNRQRQKFKDPNDIALTQDQRQKLLDIGAIQKPKIQRHREPNVEKWEQYYQKLVEHHMEYGHVKIHKENSKYPALQGWLSKQRKAIAENHPSLSEDQKQRLLALNIGAYKEIDNERWELFYKQLVEHHEKYGNFKFGSKEKRTKEQISLHQWMQRQRMRLAKNDETLSIDQRRRLIELGLLPSKELLLKSMGVQTKPILSAEQRFDQYYQKLLEHHAEYGHYKVHKDDKKYPALQGWLSKQRKKLAENDPSLTEDQRRRLLELNLGGYKNITNERWEGYFDKVVLFYSEHGHFRLPSKTKDDKALKHWLYRMGRKLAGPNDNSITADQRRRLIELGVTPIVSTPRKYVRRTKSEIEASRRKEQQGNAS